MRLRYNSSHRHYVYFALFSMIYFCVFCIRTRFQIKINELARMERLPSPDSEKICFFVN